MRSASWALTSCRHTTSALWRASHCGSPFVQAERMPFTFRVTILMRAVFSKGATRYTGARMADFRQEFIAFSIECGVLRFGSFVTKSGRETPYFFNAGLFNTGARLDRLAAFYASAIVDSGLAFDML